MTRPEAQMVRDLVREVNARLARMDTLLGDGPERTIRSVADAEVAAAALDEARQAMLKLDMRLEGMLSTRKVVL